MRDPYFGYKAQYGYYKDGDIGYGILYLCGFRYYDPGTGRFLTRDPIGYAGGINLYAYCDNDPVNRVDPDGLDSASLHYQDYQSIRLMQEDGLSPAEISAIMGKRWRDRKALQDKQIDRGMDALSMMPIPGMGGSGRAATSIGKLLANRSITLKAARPLIGAWAKDPVKGTAAASLRYHFRTHGAEVGAKSVWQYMRKAQGFNQNLKGAGKAFLDGGKIRYMKDGKYIIKDAEGKIISFGLQR